MPHRVVPSWLGEEQASRLLSYAIEAESRFAPTKVIYDGESKGRVNETNRRSRVLHDLGPFADMMRDKALALQADLEKAFGMSHVAPAEPELELLAYGDGDFFTPHIDTLTHIVDGAQANRRLSLVYYLHSRPSRFTGGRLRLLGIGSFRSIAIAPVHDSLLAFPSFVPHEVEPVACPGGRFADRRFAINIWLNG
jgi:Rps23 Pro-64 3,4-dihydroxylase Tpa1-like proline 4-hydroxylase